MIFSAYTCWERQVKIFGLLDLHTGRCRSGLACGVTTDTEIRRIISCSCRVRDIIDQNNPLGVAIFVDSVARSEGAIAVEEQVDYLSVARRAKRLRNYQI